TKLKKFLIDLVLSVSGWFLELNFIKVTALITVVCFFISSVAGQAVSAVLEENRGSKKLEQVFNSLSIPYTAGRITESKYFGSKQVIINVQDLHCHAEVQRNISRILSILDEKYKLNNIYLEGAYDNVDTSWLVSIQDKEIRQKIVNFLIDQGKLTGAEYYSIVAEKPNIIKGIENKNLYAENFLRLQKILDNQRAVNAVLSNLDYYITQLREEYFNSKQKKLGSVISQYRSGTISAKKFYTILKKYSDKLHLDIGCYRNLSAYVELIDKEKKLNYRRIASQLQKFTLAIKQNLPYAVYKELVDKTENFKKLDNLYSYLINLSKECKIDLSISLPDLYNFFDYVKLNEKINPLALLEEEEYLLAALRSRLCDSDSQREVTFAVNFFRFFELYFNNKISARDYEYFIENIDKFKFVWKKYINNDRLLLLDPYLSLFSDFYKANLLRNECFVSNILGNNFDTGIKNENNTPVINDEEKILQSLENGSEIKVVVTGGFHTEGLIKLFKKRKISYIVITPNVTTDTKISTEIYEKLAREQRKILFQAYALLAISLGTTEDKAKEILMPLINNYLNKKTFNINSALEAIKKAFNEATKSKFTLEVISQDADGFPNKIVAKEKVKGTIIASSDYDEANKKFVTSKTEEEKKADNFKLEDREASASKSTLVSVISGIWILIQTIIVAVCPVLLVSTVITLIFAYAGEFAVFAIGIIGIRKYTSDVSWMKQIIYWASQKYPKPEDFENIDKTEAPQSYIDNIAKDPIISELLKAKIRKDGKTLGENIKLVYWPELNGTTVLFQAHPEDNSIHVNYPLLKEATKDLKFNKYLNKVRMAARHDVGHIKIWRFFEKHKLLGKIRSKVPEEIREKIDENWCALGDLFDYWFITRKSRAIPSNKINFSKKAKTELPVIKENPPIIAVSLWNRLGMFLLTLIPAIISLGLTIAATAPIAVTVGIIISISLFVALPLIYLLEFLAILAGGRDFKREDYSIKKRTDDQIELKDFVWNLCTYEQWNILDVLIENGIEIIVDSSPRRYSLGRFEDGAIRLNYPAVKRLVGSKYFGWLWKRVIKNIILHEMMHGLFTLRFPGIRKSEKSLTSKIEKLELSKEIINRFYKRFLKVVRWFLQQAREILISLNDVFYFLTLGHFYIKFDPQIFTKQTRIVYAESVFNSLFKKLSVIPVERELNDSFNSLESAVNHDQVISKFIEQAQLAGVSYPEGVITLVKLVENNSKNKSSIRDMLNYIEKYKNTISEIAAAEKDSSNAVVLILAENKLLEFMASLLLDLLIDKKGNLKYIIYKFNIDSKWEGNEVYDGLEMLKSTLKLFLDSNSSLADILDLDELKNLEKRIDLISKKEILFNRFVIDAGASKEYILELLASSEEAAKAVPDFAELLEKYGNIETALDEAINSSSIVEGIKSAFNYYKQTSDPAILRLIANKISEIVIEQKIQDKKNESAYEMFETVFGKPGNKEILMIEQENDYKRNKIIYDILRAIFGKPQTKSETMLKLNDVNELAYEIREIIGEPETGEGAELKAKKLKNRMEAYGIVFKTALEFAYSFYESKPVQRSQKETILETAKKFMENIPKNQFISGEVQGIAQHEEEVALRDIKASAENRIYEETYYARGKNGEAIAKAIENIMKTVSFFERKGTPGESEENGYFEAIGYVDVLYCKSKDENYIRGLEIFFETNNNPKMFEHFIEQDILMTLVQAAPETTANLLDSICTIILKNNRSREYIVVGIAKLIQSLNTGFLAPITYEKDGVKVEMERKIFHILRDFFKKYRLSRKDFLNEFIPKEGRRTEFQTLIKLICDAIPEEKPLIAKLMFAIYFEDSDRTPESVMSAFKHAAELIGISLDNRTDTSPDLQDIIDQFALITLDYLNQEYISAPALENSKEELKQAILSSNEPYKNEIIKYLSMPSFLENIAFFGNIEDLEKAIIEGLKCTTSSDAPSRKEIDEYLSAFSLKKLEDLKQEILSSDKPFKDEIIKYLTKPDFIGKSVEDLRRLILSSDGPYRKEINEYLSAYELKNIADLNGEIREHREKNMEDLKQELLSSDEPFKKEIMKHLGPAHKSVRKFRLVILLESDLLYRKEINEYLSAFALKNNGPVEETIMDYLDINITDLKRAILSSEEPSKNEIIKSLASLALENPTIDELVNMLELSQMIIRHGDISTLTKEEKAEKPLFNTRLKFWVDLNVPPAGINYGTLESAKAAYEKARELGGIALDKVSVFGILEQLFKENLKSKGEKAFKKFIKIFIKELTMNKRPILGFTLNDKQLLAKLVFTVYFGVSDGTPKSARAAYKKAKKLTGIVLDKSLIFDILKTFLLKYFENNGEYAFTKFIRKLKLFDKQLLAKLVFAVYLEVPYMYGNPLSALETYEKASEKTKELTGTALDKSLVFDVLKDFLKKYLGEKKEYAFKKFIKGFTLYDNQMLAELLFQVYYDGSTLESALDACEMMRELTGVTLDKSLVKARQLTGIPFNKLLIFYSLKSTFKAYFKNNGKDAFEEYVKRFKLFIKDSLQIAVLIFVVYFDIGKDKTPEFAVAACRDAAKLVGIALDEQFKNEVIKYLSALALDNTQALKEAIFSISPIGPANVSSAIAALSSFETKVSDATHAKPEVNLRLEAAFISALVLTSSLWTGIQIALTPVFAIYLWFVSASLLIVGSIATFYFIVNLLLAISSTSITKSQVPIQKVMFSKSLDPNLKKLVTTDLPSELSRKLTLDENEKDKILLMIDYDLPKNISMISDYENMSIIRINPLEIIKYYRMPLKIADRIQRKIYIWSFDVKLAHEIRRIEKKLKGYRGEIKNFNYDTGYVLKQIYRAISRKNKRLAVVESESIESLSGNIKNHAVKPVTNGRKPSMSLKNRIGMLFYSIIKIVIPAGIALTVVGFAGAIIITVGLIWFAIIAGSVFSIVVIISFISIKDLKILKNQLVYIFKAQKERKERAEMLDEKTRDLELRILSRENAIINADNILKKGIFRPSESIATWEEKKKNYENERESRIKEASAYIAELGSEEHKLF
ncbi:MAG: hypothetical protein NT145_08830, partial [Elusimicrobia bacterium]|nr:hypothetical protein [Elusimicrobiota bacterium]